MCVRSRRLIFLGLTALVFMVSPAQAQDAPPADSQTEQSDESYEERLRKRDTNSTRRRTPCPPGIPCTGGPLPPQEPIDKLPAESAEHIRRQRVPIAVKVGRYDPSDVPDNFPYQPSEAAISDPSLQDLEREAWEDLVEGVIEDAKIASGIPPGGPGGAPGEASASQEDGENGTNGTGAAGGGAQPVEGAEASASAPSQAQTPIRETPPAPQPTNIYGWGSRQPVFGNLGSPSNTPNAENAGVSDDKGEGGGSAEPPELGAGGTGPGGALQAPSPTGISAPSPTGQPAGPDQAEISDESGADGPQNLAGTPGQTGASPSPTNASDSSLGTETDAGDETDPGAQTSPSGAQENQRFPVNLPAPTGGPSLPGTDAPDGGQGSAQISQDAPATLGETGPNEAAVDAPTASANESPEANNQDGAGAGPTAGSVETAANTPPADEGDAGDAPLQPIDTASTGQENAQENEVIAGNPTDNPATDTGATSAQSDPSAEARGAPSQNDPNQNGDGPPPPPRRESLFERLRRLVGAGQPASTPQQPATPNTPSDPATPSTPPPPPVENDIRIPVEDVPPDFGTAPPLPDPEQNQVVIVAEDTDPSPAAQPETQSTAGTLPSATRSGEDIGAGREEGLSGLIRQSRPNR